MGNFLLQIYTTEYGYKVASNVLLQLFLHFDDGIFPVGNVIQGTEVSGLASNFLFILKDWQYLILFTNAVVMDDFWVQEHKQNFGQLFKTGPNKYEFCVFKGQKPQ